MLTTQEQFSQTFYNELRNNMDKAERFSDNFKAAFIQEMKEAERIQKLIRRFN